MDSDDGKEKGGVTAVRKGEAMKSLEKATADYEKAKEKMEAYPGKGYDCRSTCRYAGISY